MGRLRRRLPLRRPGARRVRPPPATYRTLARHFFRCFPQLEGVRFTHAWGGAIDTCARFTAFYGTAHRGRVAYALGYTGLGVAATRFGARVMLDLLDGERTERTRLEMVRGRPLPFRRSRCAGRASGSPSGRCGARTSAAATATCGCGPWTGWASGSTADGTRPDGHTAWRRWRRPTARGGVRR
ncbi:hypothetical protein NKH77_37590 [Streptomyces sp. M19]